jgi:hypothetical protein
VATAELAWPDLKRAFLREDERAYTDVFEKTGWQISSLDEVRAAPELYLSVMKKKDGQSL